MVRGWVGTWALQAAGRQARGERGAWARRAAGAFQRWGALGDAGPEIGGSSAGAAGGEVGPSPVSWVSGCAVEAALEACAGHEGWSVFMGRAGCWGRSALWDVGERSACGSCWMRGGGDVAGVGRVALARGREGRGQRGGMSLYGRW